MEYSLSRVGVELQTKREAGELETMWKQFWSLVKVSLCLEVVYYFWGSKILIFIGVAFVLILAHALANIRG